MAMSASKDVCQDLLEKIVFLLFLLLALSGNLGLVLRGKSNSQSTALQSPPACIRNNTVFDVSICVQFRGPDVTG